MTQRYGMTRQGGINYADEAIWSLRGAKDRAQHVNNAEAARLFGEAIDKAIAGVGRLVTTPDPPRPEGAK